MFRLLKIKRKRKSTLGSYTRQNYTKILYVHTDIYTKVWNRKKYQYQMFSLHYIENLI